MGTRGFYDIFSGDRNKPQCYGHYSVQVCMQVRCGGACVSQRDDRPHHHRRHPSACQVLPRGRPTLSKGRICLRMSDEETEADHTAGKARSWDSNPQQCLADFAASSLSSAVERTAADLLMATMLGLDGRLAAKSAGTLTAQLCVSCCFGQTSGHHRPS